MKVYKRVLCLPSDLYHKDLEKVYSRFNGIILDNVIGEIEDLQDYLQKIATAIHTKDRILISYYNPSWEPVLNLASLLNFRKKIKEQNWIYPEDLKNILELAGLDVISSHKRFFGITVITIAKLKEFKLKEKKKYTVSIVIPARNEEGNIPKIVSKIPKFGKSQEIIFIEGNSSDKTWEAIKKQEKKYNKVIALKQSGSGKANAVREAFKKSRGEILMIYDADMTVPTKDLKKFYDALAMGTGEFINGSRLVYPMEGQAMRLLNKIGNHFFSRIFTIILGQHFKDTLCGTKAFFKEDYLKFKRFANDPFGDFELIFGAIENNLKVVEIPVRYKERTYGSTNIKRFKHGFQLLQMVTEAYKRFKL